MSLTFVLNDENVVNSYGFRTKNAGISLDRLRANPVMLAQHRNNIESVVGRWINIRIEGSKLLADADFDMEDEDAKKLAGKVERGFIKGASMGLLPLGNEPWKLAADGIPELVSSEAMESSIVAVPSNRASVRLYADDSRILTDAEIKLSFGQINVNKLQTMNKIVLTAQTLVLLGIANTENFVELQVAIENMAKNYEQAKKDLEAKVNEVNKLQAKVTEFENSKAVELVDHAINAKKLGADQREAFLKLAATDYEAAKKLIDGQAPRQELGAISTPSGQPAEITTLDQFEKLSLQEQLDFKTSNPAGYQKLFNN